jgi:serpin B
MMHQTAKFRYAEIPEWKAKVLELPYEKHEMSMIIILPDEIDGLKAVEEKMAAEGNLNKVLDHLSEVEVIVSLPKFKIETEMDLKEFLPKVCMFKKC